MHIEQSSISDYQGYKDACREAASSDAAFQKFKSDERYKVILEHASPEQGAAYLAVIIEQSPHLLNHLEDFKQNDILGSASLMNFGSFVGELSPSTLRYIKVLSDLSFMFGSLDNMHIVEIGGGYGGQCLVISKLFKFASYTIIDLPEANELQAKYLSNFGLKNIRLCTSSDLREPIGCDLLISNYAFSEVTNQLADEYLNKCVLNAPRGYMTCNYIDRDCYSREQIQARIPKAIAIPELPNTHPDNYILVWKTTDQVSVPDSHRCKPVIVEEYEKKCLAQSIEISRK